MQISEKRLKILKYLESKFNVFNKQYPLRRNPTLCKLNDTTSNLINKLVSNINETFKIDRYFFRYDLTLPFVLSKELKRAEIGIVYRLGPVSRYRWRQFIQADVDVKNCSVADFTDMFMNTIKFLDNCPVEYSIECNHLPTFLKYSGYNQTTLDRIDKKEMCVENSTQLNILITAYISEQYSSIASHPRVKINCNVVRGLHIYCGFVYEVYFLGCKYAMGAGGEYEIKDLSPHLYGGCSLGLDRISQYIEDCVEPVPLVYLNKTVEIYKHPLICNYSLNMSFKRILTKFKTYPLIILVGRKEIENKVYKLKFMNTFNELLVEESELDSYVSKYNNHKIKSLNA